MSARRLLGAVLTIAAVMVAAPVHARSTEPAIRQAQIRKIAAPDGRAMEITTGFVSVPEQRTGAEAHARRIDLAVIRLRWAGAAEATVNTLLAGGPGDSGTRLVSALSEREAATLLDLTGGDVMSFDQRGAGRSRPSLALAAPTLLPLDAPGSISTWLPLMERASRVAAGRFAADGIRLPSYTTVESADDVDAVRRAFGYSTMNLWGRSYGSHLALATVRRHPNSVARLILVSPEGTDHTFKLPSQTDAVIRRIGERAGVPELPANMRTVFERLYRAPVTVTVAGPGGVQHKVTIGSFDLQWLTAQALGDPRALATLPIAYREMAAGDFSRIGPIALAMRTQWRLGSAMKYMMDLASYASPARLNRIRREARDALLGNAMNFPMMDLRETWPDADLGPGFREPVRSGVPALLLVGDLDVRTPVENAQEIAADLPRSKVIVVENGAHQFDLFGNPDIQPLLRDFLRDRPIAVDSVRLPAIPFQR
ncbi:alpha/beta fold hydrolase [Sphingomonas sp. DT-207]|uniref:alpha/beta fold hydrolase n=1 Tax=Sphingomonas sp. DT-207 TaxID=3396167 RepID=UPI003F196049